MNPRILGDLENVGGSSRPERHANGFLIDAGLVAHASIVFAYDGLRPENNVLPGFVRADETWRTGGLGPAHGRPILNVERSGRLGVVPTTGPGALLEHGNQKRAVVHRTQTPAVLYAVAAVYDHPALSARICGTVLVHTAYWWWGKTDGVPRTPLQKLLAGARHSGAQ